MKKQREQVGKCTLPEGEGEGEVLPSVQHVVRRMAGGQHCHPQAHLSSSRN